MSLTILEGSACAMQETHQPKTHWGLILTSCLLCFCLGIAVGIFVLPRYIPALSSGQATPAPSVEPTVSPIPTATEQATPEPTPVPVSDDLADMIEVSSKSVVQITAVYGNTTAGALTTTTTGSGIVYKEDGWIITNAHVVADATSILITLPGQTERIAASVIGKDTVSDLAVLKIDRSGLTPATFGVSKNVRLGEDAIVIGSPYGSALTGSVTRGIISGTQRALNVNGRTQTFLQTDAAVNPGNSGGPLLNRKGEVIGIITRKSVNIPSATNSPAALAQGIAFALPIDDALPIVEQLASGQSIIRPGIGIAGSTLTTQSAQTLGIPSGVLITGVAANGPAAKAGLVTGDVLVQLDGQAITSIDSLYQTLEAKQVGDLVNISFMRNGAITQVQIVLANRSELVF